MTLPKGLVTGKTAKLPGAFGWMRPKAVAIVKQVAASACFEVTLPYPPTMNTYWRQFNGRMIISRGGRTFRAEVISILSAVKMNPFAGRIAVEIDVYPPDNRRRDLDNLQKPLLDALQHGGAYEDDSQIDRLVTERCAKIEGGRVTVRITKWEKRA